MNWSFVFSLLRFVVGRTRRASKVLRLNLLDIEFRYALAHCFQNIFERWRLALDPSQRVDARYNKRSQIRTHQSALFNFLTTAETFSSSSSTIVARFSCCLSAERNDSSLKSSRRRRIGW